GKLVSARILPLYFFTAGEWDQNPDALLESILGMEWAGQPLIVRSSGVAEDSELESLAGYYESVLHVEGREALRSAIEEVIASFKETRSDEDQILVQPMLQGVIRSGVAFTADTTTGAPYRVIEWTEGEDTTAVTAGTGAKTYYHAKGSPAEPPPTLKSVLNLTDELQQLFGGRELDIEFAENSDGLWLFQCRPLIMREVPLNEQAHSEILTQIAGRVRQGLSAHPFLHGHTTLYGVMPDWNPAEIIGTRPRPLAFSLYRELITNATWAYQRNNYGYKNLRSHPLLIDFSGLPYVDVRVSFNSFVPKDVEQGLADRLVDYYLKRLKENPQYHDKIEFDVVYTCYTFDLQERMERLREAGFSEEDCSALKESLRSLTNKIINTRSGLWRSDAERIDVLAERRRQLYASDADPVTRIYWLLEDCKRYGTLPFAGLARAGFISVSLLRSLVAKGILTESERDNFINSLNAVSSQLPSDLVHLDRSSFLQKYGHLRPGTYDILSQRYDEAPDLYFDWENRTEEPHRKAPFRLTLDQMKSISRLLEEHGLEDDVIGLFEFLKAGIELRESSKFEFTRNLSDALALIADYGEKLGFSRDDLSYLSIDAVYELYRSSANPKKVFSRSIKMGKRQYESTRRVVLPPLISSEEDVWRFELPETEPNFITQKRVQAEVIHSGNTKELDGKIVCIPSADPGFDWLFSHPVAGLITCYGGANSHMAIRANELGIPAVIGAGESNYQLWSASRRLELNCANRRVEVLA
ncbi:MAG: phosphoenolpyruvate synthase, partial [Balneolaceae bacterium]